MFRGQTAADADDVWGDIHEEDDGAEAGSGAARDAAIAAAVDRCFNCCAVFGALLLLAVASRLSIAAAVP
jgi:hypothetical protein